MPHFPLVLQQEGENLEVLLFHNSIDMSCNNVGSADNFSVKQNLFFS